MGYEIFVLKSLQICKYSFTEMYNDNDADYFMIHVINTNIHSAQCLYLSFVR